MNALFIELTSLLLLLVLGHLIDYPVFRIPAASSILLLFAIGLMLIGAVSYWLKGWKVLISVLAIILLDILIGHGLLQYRNQAFGIDPKQTGAVYDLESLQQLHDPARLEADKQHMLQVLNNWRAKFPEDAPPKMIFVNCSGGGLRATMFVMDALQKADSITNGQLMQQSMMMTGASGGMIAAAYYRELYRMQIAGYSVNRYDDLYLQRSLQTCSMPLPTPWWSMTCSFPGSHTPMKVSATGRIADTCSKKCCMRIQILSCFILFRPATRMSMRLHSVAAHVPYHCE